MQKQGTVCRWNDGRGFGFIRSPQSPADVFFHVRDFQGGGSPLEGMNVVFEEIHVGGKGPRAMAVRPATAPGQIDGPAGRPTRSRATPSRAAPPMRAAPPRKSSHRATHRPAPPGDVWLMLPLIALFVATIGWGLWTRRLPVWVAPALLLLNAWTFFSYWQDKFSAARNRWRTPESTLHLWSLAGGWPAAWLAQQVLRHKSNKASFLAVYRVTAVLNLAGLGGWIAWVSGYLPQIA